MTADTTPTALLPEVEDTPADTLHKFFWNLDHGFPEAVAACMTPDGTWLRRGEEVRASDLARVLSGRGPRPLMRHLVTNVISRATDHGLKLTALVTAFVAEPGTEAPAPMPLPLQIGDYTAAMVRFDGAWRVADLRATPAFRK